MSCGNNKLNRIKDYLKEISLQWKTNAATEHSYRAALQSLLADLIPGVTVVNEPAHIACGAPDLLVRSNAATRAPVGYVETKDIDDGDLDGNGKNREQFDRYKADLDNLIFTDYLDFRFYGEAAFSPLQEKRVEAVRIASIVGGNVVPAADDELERFAALVDFFGTVKPKPITSPTRLAALMAGKARLLARSISAALAADKEGTTPLAQQMDVFRRVLIHDLTPEAFADIYAQTITYGMFAARLHDKTPEDFSRAEAAQLLPKTNPLLRKLFLDLANDLDPTVEWIVDDLVALFAASDVAAILKNYGKSTEKTDPILHFYEDFLTAYNPTLRRQRGVWYTPDPVVNFIVRAIDTLLRTAFGLANGIADCQKVPVKVKNDAAATKRDKPFVTREMHRVQLLDLSTGTGTFIAAAIRLIHAKFAGMQGLWQGYVRENLLPRLNGFEILMASYAMAHLKIEQLLESTGYVPDSDERLRIFLSNSLEECDENTGTLWAMALAKEAQEANYIKRDCPVMVVMGNPPYSGVSSNTGAWITDLVGDYKREPGTDQALKERKQWLNDDYVKFIRLAEHYIERNGHGIVAYINNNGFIDNPTFRGMRWHLLRTFDEIYVLNLHGNSMKKETAPDGSKDENVFDIMVGTSINIFVKRNGAGETPPPHDAPSSRGGAVSAAMHKPLATVHYADLYGKREDKYAFLETHALDDVGFQVVAPTAPFYFFCPKNETGRAEYEKGFKLDELMPLTTSGFVSANDVVNISFTEEEQQKKIADLIQMSEADWRAKYNRPKDSRDWTWATARDDAMKHPDCATTVCYRPFDVRHTCYTGNSRGLYSSPQQNVLSQFLKGENIGLCAIRISSRDNHCAAFVSDGITDKTILSSKDNANVFPLYLYSENMGKVERRPNFDAAVYGKICAAVSLAAETEARLAFYRARELGKTWYDVADPREVLAMDAVKVESVDPNADRRTAKEVFRKMPPVRNAADGRVVRFTVRAAKKLLFHREINLFELCSSFDRIFAASRRGWSETAAEIPDHRRHPNIDAYHHYIAKANVGGELFYVRFTVREDMRAADGNEFHGTVVTRVCVYKAESAGQSLRAHAHGESPAPLKASGTGQSLRSHTHGEGPVPFVDNKIALFLSFVNGDSEKCENHKPSPEDVFHYVYGVLHTPSYREKYAEFLKVDFPRIPYPKDADEFRRIAGIGAELVSVHLLKSPKLSDMFAPEATFPVAGSNRVEKVVFQSRASGEDAASPLAGRVTINAEQYFDNVPESAWNASIGGYQPAQKWLKDRKGRTLTADDVLHYKSIVLALLETARLKETL